jgi:hypothetical protein
VYVKNGTLYSAAVDGTRPIALAEQVTATRSIGNSIVASTPVVSPSGTHVSVYTINGELAVINTVTREKKTVGTNVTSLGFLNSDELLYSTNPDNGKTPEISLFTIADTKSTRMSNAQSFLTKGALSEGVVAVTSQGKWYLPSIYPNLGPQLLARDGTMEQDCSKAEFHYEYNNSSDDTSFPKALQVVSSDQRYLLGSVNNAINVLDTATCQPYIIVQTHPTAMTWMP